MLVDDFKSVLDYGGISLLCERLCGKKDLSEFWREEYVWNNDWGTAFGSQRARAICYILPPLLDVIATGDIRL